MKSYSIVNRLTIWYSCSIFILLSLTCGCLYWILLNALNEGSYHILQEHIQTIHSILRRKENPVAAIQRRLESEWVLKNFQRIYVRITSDTGALLVQSPKIPLQLTQEVFKALPINLVYGFQENAPKVKTDDGEYFLVFSERLGSVITGWPPLYMHIALNVSHEERILNSYRYSVVILVGVGLFLSIWIGRNFAAAGLRPVSEIIELVRKIHSNTLNERVEDKEWSVEINKLAYTFNEMLDRLEESFGQLSRFSADMAHEIRTPLNNLQGEIEVILSKKRGISEYQEVLMSNLEETKRMGKIVDSLLFLARSENPATKISKEVVNLKWELSNILDFYEASAFEAGIRLELNCDDTARLKVERTLFQRAIGNLISNAIEHTPSGGLIQIQVEGFASETDPLSIIVEDTGRGIAKEHLSQIFERFYRADDSRTSQKNPGFGLGLSIVQGIVRLHNGKAEITSQLGQGTQVKLTFQDQITIS